MMFCGNLCIICVFVTGDCEGVGRCLVEQARRQGSQDNITAVVVFLRPVDVLMEEEAARRQAGEVRTIYSFIYFGIKCYLFGVNSLFFKPRLPR
jgi:hypothetical protein